MMEIIRLWTERPAGPTGDWLTVKEEVVSVKDHDPSTFIRMCEDYGETIRHREIKAYGLVDRWVRWGRRYYYRTKRHGRTIYHRDWILFHRTTEETPNE